MKTQNNDASAAKLIEPAWRAGETASGEVVEWGDSSPKKMTRSSTAEGTLDILITGNTCFPSFTKAGQGAGMQT